MGLTKEVVIDRIEILEDGQLQVRQATRILEDGNIVSQSFHREVVAPGDDVSAKPDMVKKAAAAFHTPEVVAKHKAKLQSIEKGGVKKVPDIN